MYQLPQERSSEDTVLSSPSDHCMNVVFAKTFLETKVGDCEQSWNKYLFLKIGGVYKTQEKSILIMIECF